MMVVMISDTPSLACKMPGMRPHAAPAANPTATITGRATGIGQPDTFNPTQTAPSAPIRISTAPTISAPTTEAATAAAMRSPDDPFDEEIEPRSPAVMTHAPPRQQPPFRPSSDRPVPA